MNVKNIYIGKIYVVTDRTKFQDKTLIHMEFIRHGIFYKKDNIFYDLTDSKEYKTKSDSLRIGEEFVNVKKGIIPLDKYFDSQDIKYKENISTNKIFKLLKAKRK